MIKVTVKGTVSEMTGARSPAPVERAIGLKHSHSGYCVEHGDSYTMEFEDEAHYLAFLDEVRTCSADPAVVSDILARHRAAA